MKAPFPYLYGSPLSDCRKVARHRLIHSFKGSMEYDKYKYAAFVEVYLQGKVEVLEEKAVPVSFSLLQTPRRLTRAIT